MDRYQYVPIIFSLALLFSLHQIIKLPSNYRIRLISLKLIISPYENNRNSQYMMALNLMLSLEMLKVGSFFFKF